MIHEFRVALLWKVMLCIILGPLLFLFGRLGLSVLERRSTDPVDQFLLFLSGAVVAYSAWRLLACFREKLIISDQGVTRVSAFATRELPFDRATGFFWRGDRAFILPAEGGYPRIRVHPRLEKTRQIRELLLRHLPDLDLLRHQQHEEQLLNDESLGTTREERKAKLESGGSFILLLGTLGLGSMIWLFLFPVPYGPALAVGLLLPLSVLAAPARYLEPPLRRKRGRKSFPLVLLPLAFPTLALVYRAVTDFHLVSYRPLLQPTGVLTLLLTVAFALRLGGGLPRQYRKFSSFMYLLFVVAAYSFCACIFANCLPDDSQARKYTTTVMEKRKTHRRRHTSYRLTLSPWARMNKPEEITIPHAQWNKFQKGDIVHLYLRRGSLRAPWYEIRK
ncbi:hypothetical protein V9K67_17650 [Paraflavisolibacter sp. H34]|uniref:hypothetical protein n=1 Tax=Huijunlia imazamoxiresistens TaxID=3127457 RepID=UPI0030181A25